MDCIIGNRLQAPEKKPTGQKPPGIKLLRIIEEIIAKYADYAFPID